jgi:hypothetical protein
LPGRTFVIAKTTTVTSQSVSTASASRRTR